MRVIGITGGVGTGKSSILHWIAEHYDAKVIAADEVGHLLLEPGKPCWQLVITLLGDSVRREDQTLDRKKIAALVYKNPELLQKMNRIIHPEVKKYILEALEREKNMQTEFFFIEAALLIEDHYDTICDELWYLYAEEEVRRERLRADRGYTDERIDEIMAQQLSEEEFSNACDFELDNSGSFEETVKQIEQRMRKYENV